MVLIGHDPFQYGRASILDLDQLFYLRSRGLREDVAKRLVIEGFLSALTERFEQGPVREVLAGALERRLGLILAA